MATAFSRALAQLLDGSLRRVLWLSIAIAAGVFLALWGALAWTLAHAGLTSIGWLGRAIEAFGGLAAFLLAVILFPAAVTAVQTSFFVDRIAAAVEAKHYPGLPPPRAPSLGEQLRGALRFLGLAVGLNLLALPVYLFPGVNVVAFLALNGYLLARENFDAIAPRRLDPDAAALLWRRRRGRFLLAGCAFALAASVPIVNLAAAILAAATSVHLVEGLRREPPVEKGPVATR